MEILSLKGIFWELCICSNHAVMALFCCFCFLLGCFPFGISFRVCSIMLRNIFSGTIFFYPLRVLWFLEITKCTLNGVKD